MITFFLILLWRRTKTDWAQTRDLLLSNFEKFFFLRKRYLSLYTTVSDNPRSIMLKIKTTLRVRRRKKNIKYSINSDKRIRKPETDSHDRGEFAVKHRATINYTNTSKKMIRLWEYPNITKTNTKFHKRHRKRSAKMYWISRRHGECVFFPMMSSLLEFFAAHRIFWHE